MWSTYPHARLVTVVTRRQAAHQAPVAGLALARAGLALARAGLARVQGAGEAVQAFAGRVANVCGPGAGLAVRLVAA